MIKNDKQYQVTKSRLKDFQEALLQIDAAEMDPLLKELHTSAIKSQIKDFEEEIEQYVQLKKGKCRYIEIKSFEGVNEALIQARIGRGWTQAELADQLEMKEQQIQRYESCDYSTASMARITEVATALGLHIAPFKMQIAPPQRPILSGYDDEELQKAFLKMAGNCTLFPEIAT